MLPLKAKTIQQKSQRQAWPENLSFELLVRIVKETLKTLWTMAIALVTTQR